MLFERVIRSSKYATPLTQEITNKVASEYLLADDILDDTEDIIDDVSDVILAEAEDSEAEAEDTDEASEPVAVDETDASDSIPDDIELRTDVADERTDESDEVTEVMFKEDVEFAVVVARVTDVDCEVATAAKRAQTRYRRNTAIVSTPALPNRPGKLTIVQRRRKTRSPLR